MTPVDLRDSGELDAVTDFDKIVRGSYDPTRMLLDLAGPECHRS